VKFNVLKSFGLYFQLKHDIEGLITAVFKSFDDKKDQAWKGWLLQGNDAYQVDKNLSVSRYAQPNFRAFYKCVFFFISLNKEQLATLTCKPMKLIQLKFSTPV